MTTPIALSPTEIQQALLDLQALDLRWHLQGNAFEAHLLFSDFLHAFECLTQVAHISEELAHHPYFSCEYHKVTLRIFTHDLDTLSSLDVQWCKAVTSFFPIQAQLSHPFIQA